MGINLIVECEPEHAETVLEQLRLLVDPGAIITVIDEEAEVLPAE